MEIIDKLLSVINAILPKRNRIIFSSFPDVSGNSVALYDYILKSRQDIKEKYRLVWAINELDTDEAIQALSKTTGEKKHFIVKKKSPKGVLFFLTSKFIISTHGYFPGVKTSRSQTHLNLWHGMPFKRIGRMLEETHVNGKKDEADLTIATSDLYRTIMAKSFGIKESSVLLTGQPVNDQLLSKSNAFEEFGIDRTKYRSVIIWLPTYRKSIVGDIREDGQKDSLGVGRILEEHFLDLQSHLEQNNALMIIKPHPMDELGKKKLPESKNIRVIKNIELTEHGIQLYELLSQSDVLLTDYSSVFIDYLITGKPIAFVCDDIDEYANSRGFCFSHPREYMPGELISEYRGLIKYLDQMEEINLRWVDKYKEIQNIFNPLIDNKASERVCNEMWGMK